jgi:NAD-dependent deacetylase
LIAQARSLIECATRIVSFSGAGLSAESGVPTFRDAASAGLWSKFDPTRLASPEGFSENPKLVIDWYAMRRTGIAKAVPNAAHIALASRTDFVHVTQNVDDLLSRAGAVNVVPLHGRIDQDRCHAACGFVDPVDMAQPPGLRSCPDCGAPLRPDVVWFGEQLPASEWNLAQRHASECGLMLVIGTSAVVHPAAGLICTARDAGARIIVVNTQPSDASHLADIELLGPAGDILPRLL